MNQTASTPKVSTAETFQFHNEDHTLGNALRWMLAKNPEVEFVGYTMPHPSEPLMNVRLQTYTRPAEEVLDDALHSLTQVVDDLQRKWVKAVAKANL